MLKLEGLNLSRSLLIFSLAFLQIHTVLADNSSPPNIILVFLDDAGYGDFGLTGASTPTPHIDKLAKSGVQFTDFQVASPVCSNSRAALLTGRYPYRYSFKDVMRDTDSTGLPQKEQTIAEMLQSRGYKTHLFGKWHLGHVEGALPTNHGFDEYYGIPYSNDMWKYRRDEKALDPTDEQAYKYVANSKLVPLPIYQGNKIIKASTTPSDQKVFTKTFTDRTIDVINNQSDSPFFIYLPYSSTHIPLFVSDDMKGKSGGNLYRDVINEIDHSMGRISAALKANNIEENTIIIFTSDNGPWLKFGDHAGSSGKFRGGKSNSFEGGVRVFSFMSWPNKLKAGTVIDEPIMTIDLLPTFADILNIEPQGEPLDGRSILPILEGDKTASPFPYYYYYGGKLESLRYGKWKLHFPREYRQADRIGSAGFVGTEKRIPIGWSLYDIKNDAKESVNLVKSQPAVFDKLQTMAKAFDQQLQSNMQPIGQY